MSLTVPFHPLRLRSDDVGGRQCFLCVLLLLVWEHGGYFWLYSSFSTPWNGVKRFQNGCGVSPTRLASRVRKEAASKGSFHGFTVIVISLHYLLHLALVHWKHPRLRLQPDCKALHKEIVTRPVSETLPTMPCPELARHTSEVDKHRLWSFIERRPVLPPFD